MKNAPMAAMKSADTTPSQPAKALAVGLLAMAVATRARLVASCQNDESAHEYLGALPRRGHGRYPSRVETIGPASRRGSRSWIIE